jgi:hypothetical protein
MKNPPLLITDVQNREETDEISKGQFIGYMEQNWILSAIRQFFYQSRSSLTVYFLVVENKHNFRRKSKYIGDIYDSPEGNGFINLHNEQKLEINSLEFTEKGLEASVNYSGIRGLGVDDEIWNYQENFLIPRRKFPN